MQFLDNRVRFLYPNFLVYMREILLQFWNFKKNYFSFLPSYGCINILCHIFNSAWNNQQQLVIFIVKRHWLSNTKISQVVHFSVCSKCPPPAFTQAQVLSSSSVWLCWSSLVAAGPISTAELSWAHRYSPAGLKWHVAFKHSSPDMVVHRVKVRRVRRPFIFTNEITAVGTNPVLSQLSRVCSWKMKPDGKTDLQSWTSSGNRVST